SLAKCFHHPIPAHSGSFRPSLTKSGGKWFSPALGYPSPAASKSGPLIQLVVPPKTGKVRTSVKECRSGSRGLGQIIMYPVITRVDIDTANRRRFVAGDEVDKLKCAERLDLLVIGQLPPVPPSAERAVESNRGF